MILKAFSIALIILSVYFIGSFFHNLARSNESTSDNIPYHIGCYEADHPLNDSKTIEQYLLNFSSKLSPYSVNQVKKYEKYANELNVNALGANSVAHEFKKYITAYENIKSLNDYEQSFNKGLKQARDDFIRCRDRFLQNDWKCKEAYQGYLDSEQSFSQIKSNLTSLISNKYEQQNKIQHLLQNGQDTETESEQHHKKIDQLNKRLSLLEEQVKQNNETLIAYQNKEFKHKHDLESVKKQLQQCQKNKKELEVCKDISARIKQIHFGISSQELQIRINNKRKIIQKYNSALAKSNKVGLDTTEIKAHLLTNQKQLLKLLQMYAQSQTMGLCKGDLIKKCSDDHILELKHNITQTETMLNALVILKRQIQDAIDHAVRLIHQINRQKHHLTQQYQNKIGSVDKLKEMQSKNQQKLLEYRDNINRINRNISESQKDIELADIRRKYAISVLDGILDRVGQLTSCLSKREYLLKLQSKRPQRKGEDAKLKKEASASLVQAIRSALK